MPAISDYNVCLSARDDSFMPSLEAISRLIDYLDGKMFLDGPDRDDSRLVLLPSREVNEWKTYLRPSSDSPLPTVHKRYVNLLYSMTANETIYKHYGELAMLVENLMPRDVAFVASLGRAGRKLNELSYYAPRSGEDKRWLQYVVVHILRGYHSLWDRVWDNQSQQKVWQLKAAKGFTFMLSCKVNPKADIPTLPAYLDHLSQKPEFQELKTTIGSIIDCDDFELIGEHTS